MTEFDLSTLWNHLASVTSLQFTSQSFDSESGWNGTGQGSVVVETVEPDTLLFHETGLWTPTEGKELNFTNVFRWTALSEQSLVRLEHLRFGKANPVYLFDLKQIDETRWGSAEPHICREDLYTAVMECDSKQLTLAWTIKGATKNELINYSYS